MEDLIGVYGILDLDHWPNAPFLLLDGGVEKRWKEPYAFHNTDRGTYSGWLMQYTLSGTGWFEVQCPMRQNDCLKKQEMFFMRMQIASQFGLHCRCIEN